METKLKAGGTYILTENVRVRKGPGRLYSQKLYKELNQTTKAKAFDQMFAVLKAGTRVVILKLIKTENETWGKIASGYILLKSGDQLYVK